MQLHCILNSLEGPPLVMHKKIPMCKQHMQPQRQGVWKKERTSRVDNIAALLNMPHTPIAAVSAPVELLF